MKKNKILIVGGSGFLGQSLIDSFKSNNIDYFNADLNPIKNSNFIYLDINNINLSKIHDIDFNFIVNLSGQISLDMKSCLDLNTTGIENIINICNEKKCKLIHISTLSIFGHSKKIISESSKINPQSAYAALKAVAENKIVSSMNEENYIILRLCNLYGHNQKIGLIKYLLNNFRNKKIHINNNGFLKRHFINSFEVSSLICKMINDFKFGIYNIATNDFFTIREIVSMIEKITNLKIDIFYEDIEPWENIDHINLSKIITNYNFNPEKKLEKWLFKNIV